MGIVAIRLRIQIVLSIFIITLAPNLYSMDELGNTEMAGLVYLNVPFTGFRNKNFSPTFGFTVGRTRSDINDAYMTDVMPLVTNPDQRKLVDIQFDLKKEQFSRFAFGGIDALVYDETLHVDGDGGGPVIDPALVILGIGAGGIIYLILRGDDNNNNNNMDECDNQQQPFAYTTLNIDQCNLNLASLNAAPCCID